MHIKRVSRGENCNWLERDLWTRFFNLRLRNIIGHFSTEFEYSSNFTTLIKIHSAVKMSVTNANEEIRLSEPKLKRFIEHRIFCITYKRLEKIHFYSQFCLLPRRSCCWDWTLEKCFGTWGVKTCTCFSHFTIKDWHFKMSVKGAF